MRTLLASASVYSLFRRVVAGRDLNDLLVSRYVKPGRACRVLDIGCGPASILSALPSDAQYVGFDASQTYIDAARARYGERGRFFRGLVDETRLPELGAFDVVLAIGVLHHLDDREAAALFRLAARALAPTGKLVTFDGCFADGQSTIARWLLHADRGQHVRTADAYVALARVAFDDVTADVRSDLLRMPYTHAILSCGQPRRTGPETA